MPKVLTPHCNFNAGEWSPLAKGRFDLVQNPNALSIAENFLLHQIGGAMFSPGTVYAGSIKDPTKKTKIMKFLKSILFLFSMSATAHNLGICIHK